MRPQNYDWKNYRAPNKASIARNIATIISIALLFLCLGYLGEQDHLAKLEQISIAKQSTQVNN